MDKLNEIMLMAFMAAATFALIALGVMIIKSV